MPASSAVSSVQPDRVLFRAASVVTTVAVAVAPLVVVKSSVGGLSVSR